MHRVTLPNTILCVPVGESQRRDEDQKAEPMPRTLEYTTVYNLWLFMQQINPRAELKAEMQGLVLKTVAVPIEGQPDTEID